MTKRYISMNGEIIPYEQATIHIASVAMKYGASVFEGIRGYWNSSTQTLKLFFLDAHLKRLLESMKLMGMKHNCTFERLVEFIEALVQANVLTQDCYIRCAASIAGEGAINGSEPTLLSIDAFPQSRKSKQEKGIRVCISSWLRIADTMMPPRIKCIANYQNGRLATLQAKFDGYDDTILLNQYGKVAESPTACIFLVKKGMLITPSVTQSILESITRNFLLTIASDLNLPTVERDIDRSECYLADEAFLCGTGAEILPIVSIDRYDIGNGMIGSITKRLIAHYYDAAYGRLPNYHSALHPITFD